MSDSDQHGQYDPLKNPIKRRKREPRTVVESWEQGGPGPVAAWLAMIAPPVGIILLLELFWWLDANVSWW